jgi:hypothetical protein
MLLATLSAALLMSGCVVSDADDDEQTAADSSAAAAQSATPAATPAPLPPPDMQLEVSLAAREVRVLRGGQPVERYPVAVGSNEWPTPTGEWTIKQVIFNPRWIPPEESWAAEEEVKEPGDPENPLGKAQLVYEAPNSIHGTNDTTSLGKAVSHGSIRVANEVALKLARDVMEAGGATRDSTWFARAQQDSTTRQEVVIPNPVRIRVIPQ